MTDTHAHEQSQASGELVIGFNSHFWPVSMPVQFFYASTKGSCFEND